jgi:hypothetical protein
MELMSIISDCHCLSSSSGVDVMSVVFANYIYTQSCYLSELDHMGNGGWSLIVGDALFHCGPHGEQLVDHPNSCCLSLVLSYDIF